MYYKMIEKVGDYGLGKGPITNIITSITRIDEIGSFSYRIK